MNDFDKAVLEVDAAFDAQARLWAHWDEQGGPEAFKAKDKKATRRLRRAQAKIYRMRLATLKAQENRREVRG